MDPNPLALARFSRWCSRLHRSPSFGRDPAGYLDAILSLLRSRRFDVLFPAHEQAYLFARHRERLEALTHLALPDFEVFERMQSKVGFADVLEELGLPTPATAVVHDASELRARLTGFPVYLKAAFGTATRGTFAIRTPTELEAALGALEAVFHEGVLVQEVVAGRLGRVQTVFARGHLVALHACAQIEEGVAGGDLIKESMRSEELESSVERLGTHLGWHGALSLDFVQDAAGRCLFIDSNPRLAEPGNALAAGLNLAELLVRVSLGELPPRMPPAPSGVRSYLGLQGLLRFARDRRSRAAVLRCLGELLTHRSRFAEGTEELLPVLGDVRSAVLLTLVSAGLLANPRLWRSFSSGAVDAYAATPRVVEFVRGRLAEHGLRSQPG